ncbi:methyl-accepting chemotaxis protein [Niallia circulans]|uniref:Methyl-accepting chemotaxis protein n=1 Tax=Niallia circulans TaxID=1397 RepID=A0A553SIJ5_NIACI|nr:methyl-accepting chemotaxis protein [Niallia circulans]TRZ36818.1 methyl-accepting chemotaxis protein [Niallia circulans]
MGIRRKVFIGFGAILLFIIGFAVVGYWGNDRADNQMTKLIDKDYRLVSLANTLEENLSQRVIMARGYVLYGDEKYIEQFTENAEESAVLMDEMEKLLGDNADYADAVAKTEKWNNLITDQVIPAYEEGGFDAAIPLMEQYCQVWSTDAMDAWDKIKNSVDQQLINTGDNIISENHAQKNVFMVMAVLTAIIALAVAAWLIYTVVKPIKVIERRLTQISDNDLSGEPLHFNSRDEFQQLANAVNTMVASLVGMIDRIKTTEGRLLDTSSQLLTARQDLEAQSSGILESFEQVTTGSLLQKDTANDMAATMAEGAKGIELIANSSSSVADYSVRVNDAANEGNKVIQDTLDELKGLNTTVNETVSVMENLGERTNRIGAISEVITNIAEQTNLLALNATIEAARAGEHGKGFAVVATEVRKLAENSKESAKEIADLIQAVKHDTETAVTSTIKSKSEMESSLFSANNAGLAFKNILASIENIVAQIQEISTTSEELSASVEEITASSEELAAIASENVDHVNAVASASESQTATNEQVGRLINELNEMSKELNDTMEKFRL